MRKIASHYLLTPDGLCSDRVVTIADDGEILSVETCREIDRLAGVEFYSGILLPGFVNAHCHLELSAMQGMIPEGCGFAGFARGMRRLRVRCTEEELRRAAALADSRMWQEGVQVVGDVCNGPITFPIKAASKICYHSFIELFGVGKTDSVAADRLAEQARSMGLRATVTPHSLYAVGREAFASIVKKADNEPISLHFLESEQEQELFHRTGALWKWYVEQGLDPDFLDGGSPTERLLRELPHDRRLLLVHDCRLDSTSFDRIRAHFESAVSWVFCPGSNRYISGERPPWKLLRDRGARIALGTDSLASNRTLSMVAELSLLPEIPLEERLRWATQGGAEALGIDDRCGRIESGMRPGLVLLEGVDYAKMELTPQSHARRIV